MTSTAAEQEREPLLAADVGGAPPAARTARSPTNRSISAADLGSLVGRRLEPRRAAAAAITAAVGRQRAAEVEPLEQRVDEDPALGGA